MKNILERHTLRDLQLNWVDLQSKRKFCMREMYKGLSTNIPKVQWYGLFCNNLASPRALMALQLACHGRLATKNKLKNFGMIDDRRCCFCNEEETLNHLLFGCIEPNAIWAKILRLDSSEERTKRVE